jgi:hypothetical protein
MIPVKLDLLAIKLQRLCSLHGSRTTAHEAPERMNLVL